MRDVEEMSVQETADLLGIPQATVRTRLFRARALLRQALARDLDTATVDVFAFAGERCDRIVSAVLARLPGVDETDPRPTSLPGCMAISVGLQRSVFDRSAGALEPLTVGNANPCIESSVNAR